MKRARSVILVAAALSLAAALAWAAEQPANGATPSSEPGATTPAANPAPAQAATPTTAHHAKGASSKSAHHAAIDLNSASKEELVKLPGVTDATADKIIGARPYKSRDELVSKNVVTKAEFEKIHERVAVKPAPVAASK